MAHVKQQGNGYVCIWREKGKSRQQQFVGEMAFTLAHRMKSEKNLANGIIEKPLVQGDLFKGKTKYAAKVYLPFVKEEGIPFTGRERKTNTGYRNINTGILRGQKMYLLAIVREDTRKAFTKKYLIHLYESEDLALAAVIKLRNEIIFENERLRKERESTNGNNT